MIKSKVKEKNKRTEKLDSYIALKSENELYYQMASIFKEVSRDENKLMEDIFNGFFPMDQSEKFMEKSPSCSIGMI